MRGDKGDAAALDQVAQDGARQGRAFLRVGARAELIEDHQRAGIGLLQDADDVGDMPAEGGQRLLDGLLIADIGVDRVEAGQLGAALSRDVQAALRHERPAARRS